MCVFAYMYITITIVVRSMLICTLVNVLFGIPETNIICIYIHGFTYTVAIACRCCSII